MGAPIWDDLLLKQNMSRQRRYQIRHHRNGLCIICTAERIPESAHYCAIHMIQSRELTRGRTKAKRRHTNARSYRL